jgi:PPM family protein phosphatase
VEFSIKTHVGHLREVNEDSGDVWVEGSFILAAVLDGLGGHQAGDVASQMALQDLKEAFAEVDFGEDEKGWKDWFRRTIRKSNERIFNYSLQNEDYQGMGTTIVAALFLKECCLVAHAGDSRFYKFVDNKLQLVTEDHSLVQELVQSGQISKAEAEIHPQRNVITRALGTEETIEIDIRSFAYEGNEQFLLCTDGLNDMTSEQEVKAVLAGDAPLQEKASSLLQLALDAGGEDNITLILLKQDDDHEHANK